MATAPEIAALIAYTGGRTTVDDTFAGEKYDEARALVDTYIGADVHRVPGEVRTQAILEVAAKLWARKGAPHGASQYDLDGAPMPVPRDPMVTAYPILQRFMSPGFA